MQVGLLEQSKTIYERSNQIASGPESHSLENSNFKHSVSDCQ